MPCLTTGQTLTTDPSKYNLTFTYDRYGNMTCQTNGNTSGPCPNWQGGAYMAQFAMYATQCDPVQDDEGGRQAVKCGESYDQERVTDPL